MEDLNLQNRIFNLETEVMKLKIEINELRKDILSWQTPYRRRNNSDIQKAIDLLNDDMAQ